MGLVGKAKVVLNASNSHEFFDAGVENVGSVIRVDQLGYAENRKCVQESDDRFDGSFILGGMKHDKSGPFLFHQEDLIGASELARL